MPEMNTAPASVMRKFAEQRAGQPALKRDRRIDRRERDGHGDDRADQFARAQQGRVQRRQPFADVALDVFHDDNGVIHHQPDGQHDRQQRQQVQREAQNLHQKHRADERNGNRQQRNQHRPQRAEK